MLAPYADKHFLSLFAMNMIKRADEPRSAVPVKRTRIFASATKTIALWFRVRQIEAELGVLSDRMLEDIGVERANIHSVAVKWASLDAVDAKEGLVAKAVKKIALWLRARQIESELEVLSDHMLDDIGVARGNIHNVAVKWASHEAAANDDRAEKAA